jgi:uncharacterized membrane protein (DUF2068 family)
MATGKRQFHMQLGIAGMFLAPAMVVTGFILVPTMFRRNWAAIQNAPPQALPPGGAETAEKFISSLVAAQIASGGMFAIVVGFGLWARRRELGLHKRLMVLATALPLPAAIDRITWLPSSYPESVLSPLLYTVAWIMPMFCWDLVRLKRVHVAYVLWFSIFIPTACVTCYVWWTPGWVSLVQRVMGVQ